MRLRINFSEQCKKILYYVTCYRFFVICTNVKWQTECIVNFVEASIYLFMLAEISA